MEIKIIGVPKRINTKWFFELYSIDPKTHTHIELGIPENIFEVFLLDVAKLHANIYPCGDIILTVNQEVYVFNTPYLEFLKDDVKHGFNLTLYKE